MSSGIKVLQLQGHLQREDMQGPIARAQNTWNEEHLSHEDIEVAS